MRMVFPNQVYAEVKPMIRDGHPAYWVSFCHGDRQLGEFDLTGDAHPGIKYLIILYFYNEDIPVDGKAPHPISLEEYRELYEAIFFRKCVYQDKHSSLDHLRSHEAYNNVLKRCGLRFSRGGLCRFDTGSCEESFRHAFRNELIQWVTANAGSANNRSLRLKAFHRASPARYIGLEELMAQAFVIGNTEYTLYSRQPLPWVRLIENNRLLLVSGRSGSGKTTLLQCIARDPDVHRDYKTIAISLASKSHLASRGDLDKIDAHSNIRYLYILDGFNELPRDGSARARVVSEISRLAMFDNVRIIVSGTGLSNMWDSFTSATMGSIKPDAVRGRIDPQMLETPLLCNAWLSLPRQLQSRLRGEYRVLEYANEVRLSALLAKAGKHDAANVILAHRVILPILSERMCRSRRLGFGTEEKESLLQELRRRGSQAYTLARYCFANVGDDMPPLSAWKDEEAENAFGRLMESGQITVSSEGYRFSHQSIRDYNVVRYNLEKLRMILKDIPSEGVKLNLDSSANALAWEAFGIIRESGRAKEGSPLKKLFEAAARVSSLEQFSVRQIKIHNAIAQIYEHFVMSVFQTDDTIPYYSVKLAQLTDWVIDNCGEAVLSLDAMEAPEAKELRMFVLCKHAEMQLDHIDNLPQPQARINACLRITQCGLRLFKDNGRLMHIRAKALQYTAKLAFLGGEEDKARRLLIQSVAQYELCYQQGSFLSGNILAFMKRTPVPFIAKLMPEIANPVESFAINLSIATNKSLIGTAGTYARNEALDALLCGEVKINMFTGLTSFLQTIRSPDGLKKAVGPGIGRPGKKALRLARCLLDNRAAIVSDNRSLTLFLAFVIDWRELTQSLPAAEAYAKLRFAYSEHFKKRVRAFGLAQTLDMQYIYYVQDALMSLLALCYLNEDLADDIDYSAALRFYMDSLRQGLEALTHKAKDSFNADTNHPYYTAKRLVYYVELFSACSLAGRRGTMPLAEETSELKKALAAFREKHFR